MHSPWKIHLNGQDHPFLQLEGNTLQPLMSYLSSWTNCEHVILQGTHNLHPSNVQCKICKPKCLQGTMHEIRIDKNEWKFLLINNKIQNFITSYHVLKDFILTIIYINSGSGQSKNETPLLVTLMSKILVIYLNKI